MFGRIYIGRSQRMRTFSAGKLAPAGATMLELCCVLLSGCHGAREAATPARPPVAAHSATSSSDETAAGKDLKQIASAAPDGPATQLLAAVGSSRRDGFSNVPLLAPDNKVVTLVVACNGGGATRILINGKETKIACDMAAHVLDNIPATGLHIAVAEQQETPGQVYVVVRSA